MMEWTKHLRVAFAVLGVAALSVSGCGDEDDDDNGTGPTGEGAAITQANAAAVQAQVSTSIGQAIAKGPGTHNGAHSGKVTITQSVGKPAQFSLRYTLDFDNYSDDGEIWYDGDVVYNLSGTNFNYTIDLTISGAYSGEIEGQVTMSNGVLGGYWNVNGQRISF